MSEHYQLYLDTLNHGKNTETITLLKIVENEYVTFDRDSALIYSICNIAPVRVDGHLKTTITNENVVFLRRYDYKLTILDIDHYERMMKLRESYRDLRDDRWTTVITHGGKFYAFGGDAIVLRCYCGIEHEDLNGLKVSEFDELESLARMNEIHMKYVVHPID